MRNDRKQMEEKNESAAVDPQLAGAIRLAVEQTLQSMGVEPRQMAKPAREQAQPKTIDLIGLMFFVLEKFWIVLLCAVIGTVAMGWRAYRSVPTYTATSKLYIVNPDSGGINIANLQLGTVLTLDYQEVFKTWEVHEMVIDELGLPYSYEQMQSLITVTNPEDTRILYISAVYPDAKMAADIANAYAKAAKEFIINIMRGEEPSDFSIALEPSIARTVSKSRNMIMGFLLGSVLAVGVLTLLFVLDDRPRTPEQISECAGLPTLAVLPSSKEMKKIKRRHEKQNNRVRGHNHGQA